ncbi:hypothetical protein TNCV_642681 [Trichonephila clavipes]|nr:hypothetical protein TNCV_642681 [Trichonephila clavipes]
MFAGYTMSWHVGRLHNVLACWQVTQCLGMLAGYTMSWLVGSIHNVLACWQHTQCLGRLYNVLAGWQLTQCWLAAITHWRGLPPSSSTVSSCRAPLFRPGALSHILHDLENDPVQVYVGGQICGSNHQILTVVFTFQVVFYQMDLDKLFEFIVGHSHNVIMIPIFILFQEGMEMFQVFDNVLVGKGLKAVQARTNFHLFTIKGTGEKNAVRHPLPLVTHPFNGNEIVTVGSGRHLDWNSDGTRLRRRALIELL